MNLTTPSEEEIIEYKELYKNNKLVYYTPKEELINVITHGIGIVYGVIGFIVMVLLSTNVQGYITAILVGLGNVILYSSSTIYHATTKIEHKKHLRKLDYSTINLVVIGCGGAFFLMTGGSLFNYIALALVFVIAVVDAVLCFVNLMKFKHFSVVTHYVVGIMIMVVCGINHKFIPTLSFIFMGIGIALCIFGTVLFGIKKRYIHCLFHVFVLLGPMCFYVANLLLFL